MMAKTLFILNDRRRDRCMRTCMDARGITEEELCEGTRRSTLEELTDWTQWADRTLVF
jgi:uncharacterized protein involved in oxidation of intracellular sulfur